MKKKFWNSCCCKICRVLIALGVVFSAIIIKTLFIDYNKVSGNSMSPTLSNNQSILVIKCAYGLRKPRNIYEIPFIGSLMYYISDNSKTDSILKIRKSFEYIAGRIPNRGDVVALNVPNNNHFQAVKRCVAVARDSIPYQNDMFPFDIVPYKGMVINGRDLNKKQWDLLIRDRDFQYNPSDSSFISLDDFIFVVGDNKTGSEDSRRWGPIPKNLVYGRVIHF